MTYIYIDKKCKQILKMPRLRESFGSEVIGD